LKFIALLGTQIIEGYVKVSKKSFKECIYKFFLKVGGVIEELW
jgi:hypothetical protein